MRKRLCRAGLAAGVIAAAVLAALSLAACAPEAGFQPLSLDGTAAKGAVKLEEKAPSGVERLNVLVKGGLTPERLAELSTFGAIKDTIPELGAVMLQGKGLSASKPLALPYVIAANPDAERSPGPVAPLPMADLSDGFSTWDQDAINVTDFGVGRVASYDGSGVYVAVLDTGLVDGWERYFPVERIATEYAMSFGGGGGENGAVSEQPNKWEHDQNSHGTHVTSSILGYWNGAIKVNGAAPLAKVIPVKVLNQNGPGWSSVIARGIYEVANLKLGALKDSPVVINMSLGGPALDAVEKYAIDYAIANGVLVVASAGNEGTAGMGYPGAYAPVISVAASGWTGEWTQAGWWRTLDVADPLDPEDFYIADFSSRALAGQDLDVAAPGSWIVGPYQVNGQASYYYLGGTSMASPHVAGVVALLCEKRPALTQAEAEAVLEGTALYLAPGSRTILGSSGAAEIVSWGADATGAGLVDAEAALAALP